MNNEEKRVVKTTAAIIRSARKRKGLTQLDVARVLNASQANVSKLENALLIPSALEWFEFCSLTGVSPESIRTGYLEHREPVVLRSDREEAGILVPPAYAKNRASKVRAVLPFLRYFKSEVGADKYERFLDEKGVDPDLFVDLDNQISLRFTLDLVRELVKKTSVKALKMDMLVQPVSDPGIHGSLYQEYLPAARTAQILVNLIRNAPFYEANFGYEIEETGRNQVVLSIRPMEHLDGLKYRDDPHLGDFLCQYKQRYFRQFTSIGGGSPAALTESDCHYHGADRCIYRFKFS